MTPDLQGSNQEETVDRERVQQRRPGESGADAVSNRSGRTSNLDRHPLETVSSRHPVARSKKSISNCSRKKSATYSNEMTDGYTQYAPTNAQTVDHRNPRQQSESATDPLLISDPSDAHERAARAVAYRLFSGESEPKRRQSHHNRSQSASRFSDPDRIAPPIVSRVVSRSGRPLDSSTRRFFERRLEVDFGGVRVHTGALAAEAAAAVDACAFTVGSNVVFNRGEYAPETPEGLAILTEELVHVDQQRGTEPLRVDRLFGGLKRKISKVVGGLSGKSKRDKKLANAILAGEEEPADTTPPSKPTVVKPKSSLFKQLFYKNKIAKKLGSPESVADKQKPISSISTHFPGSQTPYSSDGSNAVLFGYDGRRPTTTKTDSYEYRFEEALETIPDFICYMENEPDTFPPWKKVSFKQRLRNWYVEQKRNDPIIPPEFIREVSGLVTELSANESMRVNGQIDSNEWIKLEGLLEPNVWGMSDWLYENKAFYKQASVMVIYKLLRRTPPTKWIQENSDVLLEADSFISAELIELQPPTEWISANKSILVGDDDEYLQMDIFRLIQNTWKDQTPWIKREKKTRKRRGAIRSK